MLSLTLVSALAGAVLGLRYKVLVLLPAMSLGIMLILVIGMARGDGECMILARVAVAVSALQIGYLAGTVTRSTRRGRADRASAPGMDGSFGAGALRGASRWVTTEELSATGALAP